MAREEPPPDVRAYRERGRFVRVQGIDVFVVDTGAARAGQVPLLVLHGFPSSSYDFHLALGHLAEERRVVLFDYPGFGFSDKPASYSYSLFEQTDAALVVCRELGLERAHVLGHDYGTSVATELVARRARGLCPIEIESLTLANGSVHIELASLAISQHLLRSKVGPLFARLSSYALFRAQLRRIFGDPASVPEEELEAMWWLLGRADGRLRMPQLIRYVDERWRFHERWIGGLERFDRPAHVLWGRRDPIAVPPIAEALAREIPNAKLTWLDALGHYPMLESPRPWAEAVTAFLPS